LAINGTGRNGGLGIDRCSGEHRAETAFQRTARKMAPAELTKWAPHQSALFTDIPVTMSFRQERLRHE